MFERKIIGLGVVVAAALLVVSCSKEPPEQASQPHAAPVTVESSQVLVSMRGFVITLDDLLAEEAILRKNRRPVPAQPELLDRMIMFNAQVLKARSEGIDKNPEVKRRIDKILVRSLRAKELSEIDLELSQEEVQKIYQRDLVQYTKEATDRFAILVLKVDKNASPQKRSEIEAKIQKARTLALQQPQRSGRGPSLQGFAQLSMNYSDDQVSRYRGGDIGWSTRSMPSARIPKKVSKVGSSLSKGEVSNILEADDAFYLIKKTDSRPARITPLEEVAAEIKQKVLADRRQQADEAYMASYLQWAAPEKNEKNIEELSKESVTLRDAGDGMNPAMQKLGN